MLPIPQLPEFPLQEKRPAWVEELLGVFGYAR